MFRGNTSPKNISNKNIIKCTLKVILILSLEVVLKMFFEKKIKNKIF